jgi:hypothetical protein
MAAVDCNITALSTYVLIISLSASLRRKLNRWRRRKLENVKGCETQALLQAIVAQTI